MSILPFPRSSSGLRADPGTSVNTAYQIPDCFEQTIAVTPANLLFNLLEPTE